MSGSNSMCVATVLLETGILPMKEPQTTLILEAPGGLVEIDATCENGKVTKVTVTNLPSFAGHLEASLQVEGLGTLTVDTAFGGDSFVLVDASQTGLSLRPENAQAFASLGARITDAANEQIGFTHPEMPEWSQISFLPIHWPGRRHQPRENRSKHRGHQTRKTRPLALWHRHLRPDGCFARKVATGDRRAIRCAFDHRVRISGYDHCRHSNRRPPRHHPADRRSGLDHRHPSTHVGSNRSMARRLSPKRYLADALTELANSQESNVPPHSHYPTDCPRSSDWISPKQIRTPRRI